MEAFTTHKGIVVPLDRVNVDTDMIVPKQFLRKIERTGFAQHLFHELRYTDYAGTLENPDFILNKEPYRKATVLLTRDNFGCGSSREHAPWALADFGFRLLIAPSFADIFANNCVKNGILLVQLQNSDVDKLFDQVLTIPGAEFSADLPRQVLTDAEGAEYSFEINDFAKECLLKGLDQIGWTLQYEEKIKNYESRLREERSWLA